MAKKASLTKPTKVTRAQARLDGAVRRMEAAVEGRLGAAGGAGAGDGGLTDQLRGLEEENARLRALNETVSVRLDAAIGRIRNAIGE